MMLGWFLPNLKVFFFFFFNSYSDDAIAVLEEGDCVLDVLLHFAVPLSASSCYTSVHIDRAWSSQLTVEREAWIPSAMN